MDAVRRAREHAVGQCRRRRAPVPVVHGESSRRSARERFRTWVDNDLPPEQVSSSLRAVLHHVDTFWVAARTRQRRALPLLGSRSRSRRRDATTRRGAQHRHLRRARARARRRRRLRRDEESCRTSSRPMSTSGSGVTANDFFHQGAAVSGARCSPTTTSRTTTRGCASSPHPELAQWIAPRRSTE